MKRTSMKFLPIAAAILLATSCSKDGDNDSNVVNNPDPETTEVVNNLDDAKRVPFTIKVVPDNSLSKITYADDGKTVTLKFDAGDKDRELKLMVKDAGGTHTAELSLTDVDAEEGTATFSGDWDEPNGAPEAKTPLTATLAYNAESTTTFSQNSITELMSQCAHVYTSVKGFEYGDATVELADNNAYLEISMSPIVDHSIKVNETDYTVKDGRIWIAIPGGEAVKISGIDKETIDKTADKVKSGKIYTIARHYFTVDSKGTRVYFSKGNLQATTSDYGKTWSWDFAPTQYDYSSYLGPNAELNPDGTTRANGAFDLFGWVGESSTWTDEGAIHGISVSTSTGNADGYGNVAGESLKSDWGQVFGESSPWRTLTGGPSGEWKYLFETRPSAAAKYGWGQIKDGKKRSSGLILLPDDWTCPSECNFTSGFVDQNLYEAGEGGTWSKMEAAGAVFLPFAGKRTVTDVDQNHGYYWSSTAATLNSAYYVVIKSNQFNDTPLYDRYYGYSVRLVRDL